MNEDRLDSPPPTPFGQFSAQTPFTQSPMHWQCFEQYPPSSILQYKIEDVFSTFNIQRVAKISREWIILMKND